MDAPEKIESIEEDCEVRDEGQRDFNSSHVGADVYGLLHPGLQGYGIICVEQCIGSGAWRNGRRGCKRRRDQ